MNLTLEYDETLFILECVSVQYHRTKAGTRELEHYRTYFSLRGKQYSTFLGLTGPTPQLAADRTCEAILKNALAFESQPAYNQPYTPIDLGDLLSGI